MALRDLTAPHACDAKDRRDGYPVWRMFPVTEPVNEKSPCVAEMEHVVEP